MTAVTRMVAGLAVAAVMAGPAAALDRGGGWSGAAPGAIVLAQAFDSADATRPADHLTEAFDPLGLSGEPFAGYVINRYFAARVAGGAAEIGSGIGWSGIEARLVDDGRAPASDLADWAMTGAVRARYSVDQFSLSGLVGVAHSGLQAVSGQEFGLDSLATGARSSQVQVGAEIGYRLDWMQPYFVGGVAYDLGGELGDPTLTSIARSGFQLGGGLRFLFNDYIAGGLLGITNIRQDRDDATVQGSVRITF